MYKTTMTDATDEPPSPNGTSLATNSTYSNDYTNGTNGAGFWKKIWPFKKADTSLREAIEEVIENTIDETDISVQMHEKVLISNVLDMRHLTAGDMMIPRADIVALDVDSNADDILKTISEGKHSRYPVYRESRDNIIGTVHIKDMLVELMTGNELKIEQLCRSVPIISPAMPALDLLLQMRESKKHMVLVVDEYGGIDGLVTIGDIIEDIVGNIDDEYDADDSQNIKENHDGSVLVDARVYLDDFQEKFGDIFTDDEQEESDTLAGVVVSLAGHVPVRGEVIIHDASGMEFEVIDADPRRINRLKIRNIPASQ